MSFYWEDEVAAYRSAVSAGENPKTPAMTAEALIAHLKRKFPSASGSYWEWLEKRIAAYSAAWQEVEFGPVLERSMAAAVESWEAKLRALEEENARLRLENDELETALAGMWGWQSSVQELVPDGLADAVQAALRAKEASNPE